MTVIDKDGRLFGRINLVDAVILVFLALLIPVGYATFLLFRPDRPVIESVTPVEIGNEERRVSSGTILTTKLKVKGTGFNPLLRARVDNEDAVGLVFENPNSVDVIVGVVSPGRHDLVLFDGRQEVARARGAVDVQATEGPWIRLTGVATDLDPAFAQALKAGANTPATVPGAVRITALGPVQPARVRAVLGGTVADLPLAGKVERAAEIVVRCDWPSTVVCTIDGQRLTQQPPMIVTILSLGRFEITAIGPPDDPTPALVRVRATATDGLKAGDRDEVVGEASAAITSISGTTVTLSLGAQPSRDGWRYRGALLMPGSSFTMRTGGAVLIGTVIDATLEKP